MPAEPITRTEWLEALGESDTLIEDPELLTIKELAKLLKISDRAAQRRAEHLVDEGKAILGRKRVITRSGGPRIVPAYKLKKKK